MSYVQPFFIDAFTMVSAPLQPTPSIPVPFGLLSGHCQYSGHRIMDDQNESGLAPIIFVSKCRQFTKHVSSHKK